MEIEQEIQSLEKEIKSAESDLDRSKGRLENHLKRLQEFGLASEGQAEAEIAKRREEINNLNKEIESDYGKLKREYTW